MNSRYPTYLRDTTAMLNAGIRILRNIDEDQHKATIELWSEQVKCNMALIAGTPDPENTVSLS